MSKKFACPRCGHRFVLRSREEIRRERRREAEERRKQDADRKRLALIEREERRRDERGSGRPYYETYGTGREAVRHYGPRALSRFSRLRVISDFLVFGAYLGLGGCLLGAGLTIYLADAGVIARLSVLFLALVGWAVLGLVLFLGFKFLAEVAYLIAELGDAENDVVRLLLDLRENTDVEPVSRAPAGESASASPSVAEHGE